MRIIHTLLRYPPASGGAEKYAKEIVARTRSVEDGRDVRVLTSALRTHGPVSQLDPALLLDDPIYLQRLHYGRTPFFSYPRLRALKYYIGHHQPDILESYGFWYQPADTAARYARKHDIPFIFHPIYYKNEIRRKASWQMYAHAIGRKTFSSADIVAVLSRYEQSLIEKDGFPVKRFELLPPGVDHALFQTSRPNPFQKRGISGAILLSIGRISASKGLESMVRALPEIIRQQPEAQWVIIGEDFGAKKELKKLARSLQIDTHIHWIGKTSDEEKYAALQHADIFIHPSYYEAFGIVLAEAMSASLPVIARNTSAIPEVVPHEKAGLLFTTDDQLASQVLSLLKNPDQARKMGDGARTYSAEHFNWDTTIAKLLSLYAELTR